MPGVLVKSCIFVSNELRNLLNTNKPNLEIDTDLLSFPWLFEAAFLISVYVSGCFRDGSVLIKIRLRENWHIN